MRLFPGDQHVESFAFLDVLDGLLVSDQREIIAVDLKNLVMDSQVRGRGWTVRFNDCHINTLQNSSS